MNQFFFSNKLKNLILLTVFIFMVQAQAVDFYVSPKGSDDNPGTEKKPFVTIQKAKDAVRNLKKIKTDCGITVLIRGGTYNLDESLTFTPEDSGTKDCPIIYQAYPNEIPVLNGGQKIVGWKHLKQEKFIDPKAKGKIWTATVPEGWEISLISIDGKIMQRSITPNTDKWDDWPIAKMGENKKQLILPKDMIKKWTNFSDIQINYLPTPWSKWNHYLKSVEKINDNTVTLKEPVFPSMMLETAKKFPFRIENTIEGIDTPGEWCIDTKNNRVYLWPLENLNFKKVIVSAPRLENIVVFQGNENKEKTVEHIRLQGLVVQGAVNFGITFSRARDCLIDSCKVSLLNGTGIYIGEHTKNIKISNCKIAFCGYSGISLIGSRLAKEKTNQENIIQNNEVCKCGLIKWSSPGIKINAHKNIIRNNLLYDMPYSGIQAGGVRFRFIYELTKTPKSPKAVNICWDDIDNNDMTIYGIKKYVNGENLIENNIVHDTMKQLDDGGAIYCHGSHHNIVRNNVVFRTHNEDSHAIYFDDDEMFSTMENNLIYDCPLSKTSRYIFKTRSPVRQSAILLHDNACNYVYRNIIALTERPARFVKSYGGHRIIDNIFVFTGDGIDMGDLLRNSGRYKDIKWDAGLHIMDDNVYWNTENKEKAAAYLKKWQEKGWDKNSIVANPGFKDIKKRDFSFETSSIAWQMGIRPIDTSNVGIQSIFAAVK
ncbi:MAG: right-handed parallel beta-helix repeat-containing protein [Planctomycetota bacterium]|jgi:hypothetical protein